MATWTDRLDAVNVLLDCLPARWRKPALFGFWGAAGCLLGAILLGEILLAILMPGPPAKPKVDVVFALDVTSSMNFAIDGVRDGIRDFADGLGTRDFNARVGLVAFRDSQAGERPEILKVGGEPLTADIAGFREQVARLNASGGGDFPETSLEALGIAAEQPFRPGAAKVLILITDAPPKLPDGRFRDIGEAAEALKRAGISQIHLVIRQAERETYAPLQRDLTGRVFSLDEAARSRNGFDEILPLLSREIADTLRGLQSGAAIDPESYLRLIVAIAAWTAALAIGLGLALVLGQNVYLKREPLAVAEGIVVAAGSIAAGLLAGGAGQFLYQLLPYRPFQAVGWTLLGALMGGGMSFFVPNLDRRRALLGGAIGGVAGCLGFLVASSILGDVMGRLLGATALGFAIGVMVGLVEVAFREAWLEVAYGPDGKEKRTVSLGREPVAVGSDRACRVWARDAAPVAYRYKFEAGRVVCEDVAGKRAEPATDGDLRKAGKLAVMVRLTSGVDRSSPKATAPEAGRPEPAGERPAEPRPSPTVRPTGSPPSSTRSPASPPPPPSPGRQPTPPSPPPRPQPSPPNPRPQPPSPPNPRSAPPKPPEAPPRPNPPPAEPRRPSAPPPPPPRPK